MTPSNHLLLPRAARFFPLLLSSVGVALGALQHGCATSTPSLPTLTARATSDDTAVQICPLVSATAGVTMSSAFAGRGYHQRYMPVTAFLVKTHGLMFLVDAGMIPTSARSLIATPILAANPQDTHENASVDVQLRTAGISPSMLSFILLTHAHGDHAGELEHFPTVPVVMSPEELTWITTLPQPIADIATYRSASAWKAILSRSMLFNWTGTSVGPFAKSFDMFGDGSVVIIPTPGHTPGSITILFSPARTALIGDAAIGARSIRENIPTGPLGQILDSDPARKNQTISVLHGFFSTRPDWEILPAHEESLLARRYRFLDCARALIN